MTTGKDLEQKFEKVFRHSPSPFSADFSLEDKANYLKAGNDMLKAQAAEKLEAQVKEIAGKQQEIARREAALAEKKAAFDKRPSAKQRNKRQILFGGYKNLSHV